MAEPGENVDLGTDDVKPPELTEEERDFRDFVGVTHEEPTDKSWDNKRFRTIYRKFNDEKRGKSVNEEAMNVLIEDNKRLADVVGKVTKTAEKLIDSKTDDAVEKIEQGIGIVQKNIKVMKEQRLEAMEAQEPGWAKRVAALEEDIDEAKEKLQEQKQALSKAKEKPDTKDDDGKATGDPVIDKWIAETKWFGDMADPTHRRMTGLARTEHFDMVAYEPEWKAKPVAEQLKEVQKRVEKQFNYNQRVKPPSPGDVGGNGDDDSKTVKLTTQQKFVAERMKPDLAPADAHKWYAQSIAVVGR